MPTCNILSSRIIFDTYADQGWVDLCDFKQPNITYNAFITGLTETYNNNTPLKDRVFSDYVTQLYTDCLSIDTDTWVSGGTLNSTTGIATFTNTTGGTLDVTGFDGFTSYWSASTGGVSTSGTGSVTAAGGFVGNVTGQASTVATIAGLAPNTAPTGTFLLPATAAAQGNITSVGTLTSLTVDNIVLNANAITTETNVDISGGDGGRVTIFESTTFGGDGVITGVESITSSAFVGPLTGNVTGNASGTALSVTQAAQTAITSLGTLTGLGVSGAIDLDATLLDIDASTGVAIDGPLIDINASTTCSIDNTNTTNGITIGTVTASVPISIGNKTSETTINDNLTVTGDATIPTRKYELPSSTVGNFKGGDIYYYGNGSTVKGSIYHIDGANWTLADADTVATSTTLLAVALGTDPDVDGMLLRGFVTLLTEVEGTEAIGSVLYLSATDTGIATITAPTGSGDIVRVIGYSLHATDNQVYFNPDGTWVQLT